MLTFFKRFILLTPILLSMSGCMTTDPYTGERKVSKTTISSSVGAIGGGLIGAIAGGGKGALLGASIGAVGGAVTGSYLDRQEKVLRDQLRGTGVRVVRTKHDLQLIMPGDITFRKSSAEINADFFDVLKSITIVLKKYDNTLVNINGYASSEGDPTFNQRLSEKRARSISSYFRSQGIKKHRLIDRGYGARDPIASNKTAAGRSANRRVALSLTEMK